MRDIPLVIQHVQWVEYCCLINSDDTGVGKVRNIITSVRTQYYVTVRYGYHTGILRPRNIQFYAPHFTPPILQPP